MWPILYVLGALSCFSVTNGVNNGQLVDVQNFPYVVAIVSHSVTSSSGCTGGIISERFILSAAHCFSKKKTFAFSGVKREYVERTVKVYPGVNNILKIKGNNWYAVAEKIYIIKDYFDNLVSDIAILRLDRSLSGGSFHFEPLSLPVQDDGIEANEQRGVFLTAGYGDDPSNDKKTPANAGSLKQVYTATFKRDKCRGRRHIVIEGTKQLCALSIEVRTVEEQGVSKEKIVSPEYPLGTCQGDSGGPIVTRTEPRSIVGVVSRVPPECDGRKTPELHIKVAAFINDFINPVIEGGVLVGTNIIEHASRSESCPT